MNKNYKNILFVIIVLAITTPIPFLIPTGSDSILESARSGTELLVNPRLYNAASGWNIGSWRSLSQTQHPSNWTFDDGVSVFMVGNDTSFYVSEIMQHLNMPVFDLSHDYLVTWRGSVNHAALFGTGTLGVGVNLWFDVIEDGVVQEELELLVFFYQQGFYTIPVGSFKDYGYRGSNWFENVVDSPSRENDTWRFFYFHPTQLKIGETEEVTFSLSKCLGIIQNSGYETASFRLKSIHSVLELFHAEGEFCTEFLSLKQC